jgi:hypothetical protein
MIYLVNKEGKKTFPTSTLKHRLKNEELEKNINKNQTMHPQYAPFSNIEFGIPPLAVIRQKRGRMRASSPLAHAGDQKSNGFHGL